LETAAATGESLVMAAADLDGLLGALRGRGFRTVGPTRRDGAIVYDEIESAADLPAGWTDEQDGGTYRLKRRDDQALFGYAVGPHSWKRYLFPPAQRLWSAERVDGELRVREEAEDSQPLAFVGVRSCELHAIAIQDRVFLGNGHPDPVYTAGREGVFVVAVNCGQAGGTCFCVSMGTGPKATSGYDLALTELVDEAGHDFLVEVGTEQGAEVMADVPHRASTDQEVDQAWAIVDRTAASMGRNMDAEGIKDLLYRNFENDRWDEVAQRCLTCANCTMVCPTCFCFSVQDLTDLTGEQAERRRSWDSCFTMDFSYIHGGSVRPSPRSRYRQWMTHKLATWFDQFGTSGCVGCGRCITWCPVGIDITEEVAAIRAGESGGQRPPGKDGPDADA
jgi:sulfhydrogenase subunit beta (sulfur reductase)